MRDLDRIITKYNRDINGNPVTNHIIRRHTVSSENYQVVLDFIPSESLGVRILEPENVYQIYNSDELVEGTFYVDSMSGKVFFDKTMASKEILIDYYSIGLEMIGCERVYTCIAPNGDVLETLGDILNGGKEVLETLKTMGDIIVVIEELKENIKIGNDVYERLGTTIDIANKLLQDLTAKNTETRQTISNAESKRQEVIVVTNNAERKKQEVNTAISNADSKKRELESTISSANTKKGELETVITTSDTKKNELQTVINNSDTKKSDLQEVIDDSVTKKEELQAVIDNGDVVTMKSDIEKNKTTIAENKESIDNNKSTLDNFIGKFVGSIDDMEVNFEIPISPTEVIVFESARHYIEPSGTTITPTRMSRIRTCWASPHTGGMAKYGIENKRTNVIIKHDGSTGMNFMVCMLGSK